MTRPNSMYEETHKKARKNEKTNEALESVEKLMIWMEGQNIPDKLTRLSEIYNLRALIQEKQQVNYNKQPKISEFVN